MPLPPPPPPGPPPPPAFNLAPPSVSKSHSGSSNDNRGQLLADIRKGTGLKKTQTNDRSAPVIEGRSKEKNGGGPQINGGPMGGLFAGGMPVLKPVGALMPPGSKRPVFNKTATVNNNDENSQQKTHSYPNSPQIQNKTSSIPAGFGTVRKNFLAEAMKSQAPLPPPATLKPNGSRPAGGPILPNKAPNVRPAVKITPPANKPPPPPKSPAVFAANGPPALPSKPPSCRRIHSFNENDVRQSGMAHRNSRPNVQVKLSPTDTVDQPQSPQSPETLNVRPPSFKNVSTPNLAAVNVKSGPPPLPPSRDNTPAFQQFHTMPGKLNGPQPPPPPSRTTPYQPKPPNNRPPPPPPVKPIQAPPNPPPPPPPHRVNPPPPIPQPPLQQQINRSIQQQQNSCTPPPPPVRISSSARNSMSGSSLTLSNNYADELLESRVYHMFVSLNSLPAPDPFTNAIKTYASKNTQGRREAAPPIPTDATTHVQLGAKMWANPASEC